MKIFVTIGTYQPFDRLIEVVDKWFKNRNDIEGFAQIGGGTYLPQNIKYQRVLSEKEFNEKFDEADFIVSHAGMGTIISCLNKNKPILTLPRMAKFDEHVNDHQLANAKIFSEKEYIYPVFDEHELLLLLDNIKDIKVLKIVNDYADDALIGFLSSLCD